MGGLIPIFREVKDQLRITKDRLFGNNEVWGEEKGELKKEVEVPKSIK